MFFLSGLSSQSIGVGSQPMGIDGKDGLTVVACLKDVSFYSLYQRDRTSQFSQYAGSAISVLIAHSNGSVFYTSTLVNKGEWL